MKLQSSIVVPQSVRLISEFFSDPHSLAKWDRSVAEVIVTSSSPVCVGFTFDTISPAKNGKPGFRMHYRIIQYEIEHSAVELVESKMFKKAIWHFQFEPVQHGTRVTCFVDMKFRWNYFWLIPLLFFNKKAILTDLHYLKSALEKHELSNKN